MAEENGAQAPTISGNMLFYKQPELLNINEHAKLGVSPLREQPFAFLKETQIIPITIGEFGLAATNYPIVFAGEEKTPAAVMGIKQDRNAFIDDEGKIADNAYIPAFVRRYPFASAKDSNDITNLMVCIDRASPMITENADNPFFDGTELTETTKQAVEFVKAYEAETAGATNFIRAMNEMDLFESQDINVAVPSADGTSKPQKLGTFMGISDEKLAGLSGEKLIELRDNGGLAAIYAHKMSQVNWQRLLNMEMLYDMQQSQTAGQA